MSEETKPANADISADGEKKDAEGQGIYRVYCDKCGWSGYYHDYNCTCRNVGCYGTLRRI